MPLSRSEANCLAKTARGNWFKSKSMAKHAASRKRRSVNSPRLHAYRCPHCPYYHVGKSDFDPARAILNGPTAEEET